MSHEFIDSKKLAARIAEVRAELAKLLHLESFLGTPKRSRKPGAKVGKAAKAPKAKGTKRGPRGALGEKILAFLGKKGAEGAHVKEIAGAIGSKPVNVTQYFYGTGKKVKGIKKVKPNTFAYAAPKEGA